MSGIFELAGVEKSLVSKTILTIDKIEKVIKAIREVNKDIIRVKPTCHNHDKEKNSFNQPPLFSQIKKRID